MKLSNKSNEYENQLESRIRRGVNVRHPFTHMPSCLCGPLVSDLLIGGYMEQFGSWDAAIRLVTEKWKQQVALNILVESPTDWQLGEACGLFYAIKALERGKEAEIYNYENEIARRETFINLEETIV